jgi:sialidase-1
VEVNARNQKGDIRARIVSISHDGGQTWDSTYADRNLPDPVCQGSILTIGHKRGKNIIAFCNAADTQHRNRLTLRISYDEGVTWKKNLVLDSSATLDTRKDYTAYSDIVVLPHHQIGVLYEKEQYSKIVFMPVAWKK